MGFFEQFPYTNFHDLNLDWIIKKTREALNQVEDLSLSFAELQNHVLTYFKNLDLQDEVGKKLDEMAVNGQLGEIIALFMRKAAINVFDTVSEMENSKDLVNGSYALTGGYRRIGVGGALYRIENGGGNGLDEPAVNENLHGVLLGEIVTPEMCGAYGDNVHDDSPCFNAAISKTQEGGKIRCESLSYRLDSPIVNNKNITFIFRTGTTFSGNGAGNPSEYAGLFPSPATNPGNIVTGTLTKNTLNVNPPIGNGVVVNSNELIENGDNDYTTVSGSIEQGSNILKLSSLYNVKIGDAVILKSPNSALWPAATGQDDAVRIVALDSEKGWAYLHYKGVEYVWDGGSLNNAVFTIRRRAWNCAEYIGIKSSEIQNPDRYSWGQNIVGEINGCAMSLVELELHANKPSNNISRAIFITGHGTDLSSAMAAIDVQRNPGRNWEWGLVLNNCNQGIKLNAYRPIVIETAFKNADDGGTLPPLFGIVTDNVTQSIREGWRPTIAIAPLMSGATALVLESSDDGGGALLSVISKGGTDEYARISEDGTFKIAKPMFTSYTLGEVGEPTGYVTFKDSDGVEHKLLCAD